MSDHIVAATDLVLGYQSNIAVKPSSFTMPAQAVTAIIGPNGSGKSTLLHALAGVIPIRSGTLEVLGQSDPRRRGRKVSYVMQTVLLPEGTPLTVQEAVAMGRYSSRGWWRPLNAHDREVVTEAMQRLDIADLARQQLAELSGGQRQRVYVAQGIAQEHDVLLLDEPLTGLDIVSARTIDHIIHTELDNGQAVVLTTHDLDEARAADHVLLMNGQVLAFGAPEEVLTHRNLQIAYGLGSLHSPGEELLDDPSHTATKTHVHG